MTVNAAARIADRRQRNRLLTVRILVWFAAFCTALLAHTAQADEAVAAGFSGVALAANYGAALAASYGAALAAS
jgi:hypothetical protein